jgi:hypothetical protein
MDPNGEEYFEDEDDVSSADDKDEDEDDESSAVVEVVEEPVSEFAFQELPDVRDLSEADTSNAEDPLFPEVQPAPNSLENQMAGVEEGEELPNTMRKQQQRVFKDALRKHWSYAYSNGQIQWPKRFTKFQKDAMPILQVSMAFLICVVITCLRNLTSGIYMYPYKSMDRAERIFVEPY